ncbi:proline-rich antigen-like isoform X6 [Talpa occidentalis]|uniref:proline-rich antigen-like isoform X6 n=1 Tax=Talpa occidentalis TaxID=50954 RepID=UPI0023F92996|nr:proline-rich antigen-like isoform X6 [Talpa occidentalis]
MKDQGGLTDDLGKQSAVGTPGTLLGKGSAIKGPGDTQSLLLPAWLLSHNPQRTGPAAEAPGSRGSSEPPLVLRQMPSPASWAPPGGHAQGPPADEPPGASPPPPPRVELKPLALSPGAWGTAGLH